MRPVGRQVLDRQIEAPAAMGCERVCLFVLEGAIYRDKGHKLGLGAAGTVRGFLSRAGDLLAARRDAVARMLAARPHGCG